MTPSAETLAALDELVREGVVGAIGCSNFSAAELEEAERISRERGLARYVTLQNEYSLLERGIEAEVAPTCERLGVSILPFFPLAKGMLTGKYRRGEPPPAGHPPGRRRAAAAAASSSTWSRRWRRSPRSAGSACSTSRSPASRRSPRSPR